MAQEKVRWGVLSTAQIGLNKVLPGMRKGKYSEIAAIASRDLARARAAAERLGISKAYGSYEALLADPEIDAIYNPLPIHLHVPWTIRAIEAGKHVLFEKPMALNATEAQQLADAAARHPGLKVMEAFMYRFHPQWIRAKAIVDAGGIGELKTIQSFFSFFNDDGTNIRNRAEVGGGGLLDLGCYNLSLSRFIFGAEPQRVTGIMEYDPRFGTDRLVSGILDFGRGSATFTFGTQLQRYQRVHVFGTTGRVELEIPLNAPTDVPCKLWHGRGDAIEEILVPATDQYTAMADLFARAVLDDTQVPTPLSDGVANMRLIDALKASAGENSWVTLP